MFVFNVVFKNSTSSCKDLNSSVPTNSGNNILISLACVLGTLIFFLPLPLVVPANTPYKGILCFKANLAPAASTPICIPLVICISFCKSFKFKRSLIARSPAFKLFCCKKAEVTARSSSSNV